MTRRRRKVQPAPKKAEPKKVKKVEEPKVEKIEKEKE